MSSIDASLAEVRVVLGEIADGTTDASTRDRLRDVVSRIGSAAELSAHFAPRVSRDFGFTPLTASHRANTFAGMTAAERARAVVNLRKRVVRSNFVTSIDEKPKPPPPPPAAAATEAIAIVDALSTGACIAADAQARGYAIVHVVSFEPSPEVANMVPAHLKGALRWHTELFADENKPLEGEAERLARALAALPLRLAAVVAGAETGVKLADHLSEACGVRTNGARGSEARRNKWDMGEKVRAAGVRAVMQLQADAWAPVSKFLDEWTPSPFEVIVKPVESAGSDGVTLCGSRDATRAAVDGLVGKVNGLGVVNAGVLVQEFLKGDEYVVDGVSRDGEHKVIALWRYDRRPTNGAGFVLHGQVLIDDAAPEAPTLIGYAGKVLDALEFAHGPSHMEIKLNPSSGPCLVEVGARCHGAEGFWCAVADEAVGYNQASAALEAYVDAPAFAAHPPTPVAPLRAAGRIKYLLFHRGGALARVNPAALAEICAMASYRGHEVFVKDGSTVAPTIDCFTWGGAVKMANPSEAAMQADYARIEALCLDGLWEFA